jgi:hypothetical protein
MFFLKKKQNLLQTETLKKKGKKIKKKSSPVIEKSKAEKASSSCLRAPLQPAR